MKHIIDVLTMHKDTDSTLIKEIKQKMKDDNNIMKRYNDDCIQQLLDKAAFVDPRFKRYRIAGKFRGLKFSRLSKICFK